MNRDSNMAAPPTPRLPALVKVFLTVNYQLLTLWFANKYFPSTKNIGEKMFYVFSLQVAGATACLITILYFTYLLRYIFMYASSKLLSRTHYANENSSFLIHPCLSSRLWFRDYIHAVLLWTEQQPPGLVLIIFVALFTLVSLPLAWGYIVVNLACGNLHQQNQLDS